MRFILLLLCYISATNIQTEENISSNNISNSTVNNQNISVTQNININDILSKNDLNDMKSTFLVFLFYERKGVSCPACAHFMPALSKLYIPVKYLNFAENISLGSRFLQYKFPSFIIRAGGRSYVLQPTDADDLIHIINSKLWLKLQPVSKSIDVNSYFTKAFSSINPLIFKTIRNFYIIADNIPEKLVFIIVICVITYLLYSIFEIFMEPDLKLKTD